MTHEMAGAEDGIDLLVEQRFFPKQVRGAIVEVGAARPDYLSMSALYRNKGWRVLSIEPNPAYAAAYAERGLEVLPYACGPEDRDGVDFTVVNSHGEGYRGGNVTYESWSSLALTPEYAGLRPNLDTRVIKVDMRRLDTMLGQHAPEVAEIDIVSVDVEGWELEVLNGLSFPRYRPKVLILENLFTLGSYRRYMKDRGYALWRYIPPNEIYVRRDLPRTLELLLHWPGIVLLTGYWRGRRLLRRLLGRGK
jgi:FkbM family methyltransferase